MTQSLTERQRGELFVVAGFLLLLNPFVVGALDLGDPDSYTYEPKEVTFYDNGTYDAADGASVDEPEVACFDSYHETRACTLERAIHAGGGIEYAGDPSSSLRHDYRYVYVYGQGFFEPTSEDLGNGTYEYGLEPVAQSRALADVAEPSDEASLGVRQALEDGQYRTSDQLDGAGELVTYMGSYYVVTERRYDGSDEDRRGVVVALQWIAGIAGARLILRGQRLRVAGTG